MTKLVYMIIAAFVLACLSCGDSGTGPADTTWTVSGTLTCSLAADGIPAYVGILTGTPPDSMTLVYLTTAVPFAGGVSTYSFSDVTEGSYYLGAIVDMDSNADPNDPSPDDGDLIAYLDLVVNGDEVLNVLENDWDTYSGGGGTICVSGDLNKYGVADGILGYVVLTDSSEIYKFLSMPASFSGGWAHYNIYDVEEDSYRFAAMIDMNNNANPNYPVPDVGDWVNDPYFVWIDQNTQITVYDADWSLWAP